MKYPLVLSFFLSILTAAQAQRPGREAVTKNKIDAINRLLDHAIVERRAAVLRKYYAPDFIFTHYSGSMDTRESWLKTVKDTAIRYVRREHDSVLIEVHPKMAIVTGTLTVHRQLNSMYVYAMQYIRIYTYRKRRWQLAAHRSIAAWDISGKDQ